MDKRVSAVFSGTVQGVGFRFTARMLADRHKVKGWVRNTQDGKVEIVAEGESKDIDDFLDDLKRRFENYISNVDRKDLKPSNEYQDFQVKF